LNFWTLNPDPPEPLEQKSLQPQILDLRTEDFFYRWFPAIRIGNLLFYIQTAGFGVDVTFFRQLVKGVAQLPGIEFCSLLQMGDSNALGISLNGIKHGIRQVCVSGPLCVPGRPWVWLLPFWQVEVCRLALKSAPPVWRGRPAIWKLNLVGFVISAWVFPPLVFTSTFSSLVKSPRTVRPLIMKVNSR